MMNAEDWIAAYAEKLGTRAPSQEEIKTLLELARVAAHASERAAAPVACWIAARAGHMPGEALALAKEVAGS